MRKDIANSAGAVTSVLSGQNLTLMWAAGVNPQDTKRFRGNRFYKSAMHAAVEYPDLSMLMWEGGSSASQGLEGMGELLPGTKQVSHHQAAPQASCIVYMLRRDCAKLCRGVAVAGPFDTHPET